MNPEDWSRVEEIFHGALDLDTNARRLHFATFSPSDEWLVKEVQSLLSAYDLCPDTLEQNAFELGLAVLEAPPEDLLTGQTIGFYKVLDLLGRGGMGDVYLAEDLRLGRKVALKFLSAAFSNDAWAKRQLVHEAKAVAMLDHKNICPVYGYEEIDDHRFIVMQYVDGVSLAELISSRQFEPKSLPVFALEIAEAIAEAHAHGIIHRDIKPGNIMIAPDGHLKVLDFGLAKFIDKNDRLDKSGANLNHRTRPGLILGTIGYMSPEQLKAEKLDFRSDIFSIGTVLYELITGAHPFSKESDAETISAILENRSPIDQGASSRMPAGLGRVVKKCLAKEKENRYQSASELVLDLQQPEPRHARKLSSFYWRILVSALLLLVIVAGFLYFLRNDQAYSMAVLPYQNQTGDAGFDYLADGIADSLTTKLASYGKVRLKAIPVRSPSAETNVDPIAVGRENAVDLVLTGNIIRQNDQLILRTDVLDVRTGVAVRGWKLPFQLSDLPELEAKVSDELFAGLKINGSTAKTPLRPSGAFTENGEAFRQYLIGRYYWKKRDKENIKLAIAAFDRAIELDPGYSRPYSGLADSYVLLSLVAYGTIPTKDAMTRARAAARQALEIDPYDAPAHTSLGIILTRYEWNWAEAEKEFRLSIQTDPDYPAAHYWYSDLLAVVGRSDESIAEAKKAKDLDPFSPLVNFNLGRTFYYARQYDRALEVLSDPSSSGLADKKTRYMMGLVYIQKGMYRDAQKIFEDVSAENRLFGAAALGYTYAMLGRRDDALELISELRQTSADNYVPPQEIAIIYIGLHDKENAIRYLNDSFKERHPALVSLKVEPLFDALRTEAGFNDLLHGMGLK